MRVAELARVQISALSNLTSGDFSYRMPNDIPPEKIDAICQELFAGHKIEAIKLYRAASGQGLKEAKEFVEALEARLRQEAPEKFSAAADGRRGCGGMMLELAALVACFAAVLYFLLR